MSWIISALSYCAQNSQEVDAMRVNFCLHCPVLVSVSVRTPSVPGIVNGGESGGRMT